MSLPEISKLKSILVEARNAFDNCEQRGNQGGCARVYIQLLKMPRKGSKAYNLINEYFEIFNRPYGAGRALYCGYDNATGAEWFKAHAAAKVFEENGIKCYVDADMD